MQLLLETYMPELERLKMDQNLLMEQQQAPVHQKDTVRITTSNLPELSNWGVPTPAPMAKPRPEDDLSRLSLASSGDLLSDAMPISSGTATAPVNSYHFHFENQCSMPVLLPCACQAPFYVQDLGDSPELRGSLPFHSNAQHTSRRFA